MADRSTRGHEYAGRENGLMVIASPKAIRDLGAKLSSFDASSSQAQETNWPREIARANLGPEAEPYSLSFHRESEREVPPRNVPRNTRAFWLLAAMAPLALVGIIAIAKWVAGAF